MGESSRRSTPHFGDTPARRSQRRWPEAEAPYAFVAPSFPETGRTVRDGVLYIHGHTLRGAVGGGAALGDTGTSSVVDLLAEQTGRRTGLVDLATVEAGASAIRNRIGKLISAGITILVFDAVERSSLQRIVSAVIKAYPDGLLAGSAGLSSALARRLRPNPTAIADSGGAARDGPVLVVAGSVNPVTLAQLDRLANMAGVNTVWVDGASAAESADKADAELRRTLRGVASAFGRGRDVVIRWTPKTERLLASTQAPTLMKTGDLLSGFLQHLSAQIFAESRPAALILHRRRDSVRRTIGTRCPRSRSSYRATTRRRPRNGRRRRCPRDCGNNESRRLRRRTGPSCDRRALQPATPRRLRRGGSRAALPGSALTASGVSSLVGAHLCVRPRRSGTRADTRSAPQGDRLHPPNLPDRCSGSLADLFEVFGQGVALGGEGGSRAAPTGIVVDQDKG